MRGDLAVALGPVRLANPTVLASGILGLSASSALFAVRHGAGAVTLKSCGLEPRAGHPGPAILPIPGGLLNAVGLANPGMAAMNDEVAEFRRRSPVPCFVSIFGRTEEEFARVAAIAAEGQPDLIEVNVSCPNVASEFGTPFSLDPAATARITEAVKVAAGAIPVAVKLSPQSPRIGDLARACEDAGADVITAINTVGPGMVIDPEVRRPILSNGVGGLSGPAILPLAVRAVYEIAEATNLPVIGTGGITDASGALQVILAGATAVGIGTGVYQPGPQVFQEVCEGLADYLERHGCQSLDEIRGAAHG